MTRAVKFFEKGERPVEIVTSRQWFIRTIEHREELLARGRELRWHPPYMRARFEDWVDGLTGDWCVSRQRFFGVPFPRLVPARRGGPCSTTSSRCAAREEQLPVDPSTDVPDGYAAEQRGQPGGFAGDPDVMDTWATSSLTPQIAGAGRARDDGAVREASSRWTLRPQAHDIIRTWLFSTILRSHLDHDELPWSERGDLRLGARPRPQEDVEVQGQRRHADAPARGVRRRRGALLGGERAPGHRHRVRPAADEGRAAPRGEAAERLEVRAGRSAARRARRSRTRSTAR